MGKRRTDAPLMLGVSGMRGIVGASLTPDIAARFASAFGSWLARRAANTADANQSNNSNNTSPCHVVIGRDGRVGGDVIANAAIAGLRGAGCNVTDIGIAMTPTIGVCVDALEAHGGIVVTASHNPQEWNGLKAIVREPGVGHIVSAAAPDLDSANSIIAAYENNDIDGAPWNQLGEYTMGQSLAARGHLNRVSSAIEMVESRETIRELAVNTVLDSVNGAGRVLGAMLLEGLGCRVTHLGNEPTGLFPHPPEPTRENLSAVGGICSVVKQVNAAVGFAQDPDADRLALIDETGHYIGEEYTLALAAEALLATGHHRGKTICANLSTSRMIDDIAERHGLRVLRTPVGEANVVSAMKQNHAIIGGEGNGGVIWPQVTYVRDSLGAMALVLSLLARTKSTISRLVADIPAYAIVKRKTDLASKADAQPLVTMLASHYAKESGARVDTQDGVRIDWPDDRAWVHVRASNTEPILRLIAEAPSEKLAVQILEQIQTTIDRG